MSGQQLTVAEHSVHSTGNFFQEKWKCWCRLCAKADAEYINVISAQGEQPIIENSFNFDMDMAHVVGELFRVNIKEDDKLPQVICTECYGRVKTLLLFSERVNKVQQMYGELQNSTDRAGPDLHMLLVKYGVFKDETLIPQYRTDLPIEEIFVADLSVTDVTNPTNVDVKTEKCSVELQVDTSLPKYDKKDGFHDPIGDEDMKFDQDSSSSSDEDEVCSGSEDDFMDMDSADSKDLKVKNNGNKKSSKTGADQSKDNRKEYDHFCSICSQSFQRRSNYSAHMKKKHGVILCPQCPNSFKTESNMKRHMKDHQKLFSCMHCGQEFERKGYMSTHIRNEHKSIRPYVCEACGESVRTKKQLKQHMLTHTDYTPYECKECGKSFKERYRLKRHLEIHGDKHICTECGKQLSCRATFNSHMLVHSDKMPHKCDYCGRTFKRAKTLKYHLIAHTGLRPYSCDFCEKTFSTGSSCRFHKKTMHPAELAELEASGAKTYTKNVPKLNALKAVARTGENFVPLTSKQKGYVNLKSEKDLKPDDVNFTASPIVDK